MKDESRWGGLGKGGLGKAGAGAGLLLPHLNAEISRMKEGAAGFLSE